LVASDGRQPDRRLAAADGPLGRVPSRNASAAEQDKSAGKEDRHWVSQPSRISEKAGGYGLFDIVAGAIWFRRAGDAGENLAQDEHWPQLAKVARGGLCGG